MQELTASPKGDRQKAAFMAQFLSNGKLTPQADELAKKLLKGQYTNIKNTYGEYADYTIAQVLAESGAGSMEARLSLDTGMIKGGVGAPFRQTFIGMSPLNYANLAEAQRQPGFGERIQLGTGAGVINPKLPLDKETAQYEITLSMLREIQQRDSALTAETAATFRNMAVSLDDMKKRLGNWADETKNIFFDWLRGDRPHPPEKLQTRPSSTTYSGPGRTAGG
jgi:hypothetical protein